jgi:hypothetical protein
MLAKGHEGVHSVQGGSFPHAEAVVPPSLPRKGLKVLLKEGEYSVVIFDTWLRL